MGLNNLGLGIVFTAKDFASNVIGGLATRFSGLENKMAQGRDELGRYTPKMNVLGSALKGLAVGVTLAAVGMAGLNFLFSDTISEAATLQDVMLQIQQKTGFADDAIQELTNDFLKLSASLPLSAVELAKVGVIAGQLGIQSAEGIKALAFTSAQLARTTTFTEETAASALARLSNVFNLPIDQADRLASSLVRLANTSTATATVIAEITGRFAGTAKFLGITVAQANAFSATLVDAGLSAEVAGSAMGQILGQVTARSAEFAKQLGISKGEFEASFGADPTGTLQRFFASFEGIDKFKVQARLRALGLSGIRVQRAVFGLASSTEKLTKNLETSTMAFEKAIALQEAFDKTTRSLNAKLDTFRGSLTNIKIAIGNVLLPVAERFVDVLNLIATAFLSLPESVRTIGVVTLAFGSLLAVVAGVGIAIAALLPILGPILGGALAAAAPFIAAIAVGLAGLAAEAAVLRTLWVNNFGGIKDIILPILEKITLAVKSLFALFTEGQISGALAEDLAKAENQGIFRFVDAVSRAAAVISAIFRGVFFALLPVFRRISKRFAPAFKAIEKSVITLGKAILEIVGSVAEALGFEAPGKEGIQSIEGIAYALTELAAGPMESVLSGLATVIEFFAKLLTVGIAVARGVANIFITQFRAIKGAVNAILSAITNQINTLIGGINTFISGTAQAIAVLPGGTELAQRIQASQIGQLATPQLGGAEEETGAPVGPQSVTGTAPGAISTPPTSIPSGVSQAPRSVLSNADVAALISALDRQGRDARGTPIQVQLNLDGRRLAEVRAEEERDTSARRGRIAPSIGR